MRFGESGEEAAKKRSSSSSARWIKYLKDGSIQFRILEEPDKWIWFWEHFNPAGYSFPCTNERDTCPGCTSDVEKMKKASRKVAFNVLEQEKYVNVFKIPPTLADKLTLRYERLGTITDRDYVITRFKSSGDRVEYDVEGTDKLPRSIPDGQELLEVEELLQESYDQSWGSSAKVKNTNSDATEAAAKAKLTKQKDAAEAQLAKPQEERPPSEPESQSVVDEGETEVGEDELRAMSFDELSEFLMKEKVELPAEVIDGMNVDKVVDWLIANQS